MRELLAIAREAARIAGEVVMPLFRSGIAVELKADRTPVTLADRNAEEAIRAFLARECPGHGVLGEEFGETPGDGRHRWILDPIDGTKSFVHGVPLFGTLVALERDGQPVVGVIACHAAGETASAATGCGAWINGQPAHVSDTAALADATVLITSFQRMPRYHPAAFAALNDRAGLLRTWGDCYGYLLVAAGRADIMLDPVMNIWDAAALYPVITEAGGRMTTWQGTDGVGDSVVASNGILHEELLAILRA
ncbi:MAG: histidinol-phosphatase [Dehalococcoidia bacterium]|nr:histidinol-phosphatase [Dehalococcoidia bacterium]